MISNISSDYSQILRLFNFNSYNYKNISLKELMKEVKNCKISTTSQYRKLYKKNNWPSAPNEFYQKDWVSWTHFFGKKEKKFLSWEKIREDIRKHNIKNMSQYNQYRKNKKSHIWPSNPNSFYKEWISARHFFTGVVFPEWENFCNQVRNEKIKTRTEYKQKRKESWPKTPEEVYKKNWVGWGYLFYEEYKNDNWPDFNLLHQQVLKMNFKSQDDYKKKRNPDWPSHPETVYNEFKSWTYFLQGKTTEEVSNEICMELCLFINKNKRMPSRCKGKEKNERKLYSYLERRRRGDQEAFASDLRIAKNMGMPDLFIGKNLEEESNKICSELCKFIKTNKRLPSAKSKNKYERRLKNWMWSRFTCQDKKWQKKSYPSDIAILKKEKLYDFIKKQ